MPTDRATNLSAIAILTALAALAFARQPRQSPLTFEVAAVKPSKPGAIGGAIRPLPGGQTYVATNAPLKLMIKLMFHLTDRQISGGPAWINTDPYDVEAKAEHPSTLDQLHLMFQNLLIERFQLKFHRESKEMARYALVIDKSGSKLKVNDNPEPWDFPIKPGGPGKVVGNHVSMSYFTWFLAQFPMVDRPVVDMTGLTGHYDFNLDLAAQDRGLPGTEPSDSAAKAPDLFTALREQLGLKLEAQKGPVEVFVIDHAEKPAGN